MSNINATVECPVNRSFRVEQLAGMFDVELEQKVSESFAVEIPDIDDDWKIGVIVGPSGSGKSTIAREAFGNAVCSEVQWPKKKAVVDGFGERTIKEITRALTAVGFSSPPSWVKPYRVLSTGEQFRCDLARALLADNPLVVFDEFTSVVDRTVAKIGSAAVSKAIRKGRIQRKFVAVTCHYDVVKWLEPDWVVDMASGRLARGQLRRPEIRIEIAPVHYSAWVLFRRHHYLAGNILMTARCFAAFFGQEPVGFSAWVDRLTRKRRTGDKQEHRTVVVPDYQGVGIGNRLSEFCASIWTGLGGRAFSTTGHPAMIRYRSKSAHWKRIRLGMVQPYRGGGLLKGKHKQSSDRFTGGFQYIGPTMDRSQAAAFLSARPEVFARRDSILQIEELVKRYPGATAGVLARLTGRSSSSVRHNLQELIDAGEVTRAGHGGVADPHAFYP